MARFHSCPRCYSQSAGELGSLLVGVIQNGASVGITFGAFDAPFILTDETSAKSELAHSFGIIKTCGQAVLVLHFEAAGATQARFFSWVFCFLFLGLAEGNGIFNQFFKTILVVSVSVEK